MNVTDNLSKVSCGALFRRADLHIHSYGGSYDVKDSDMTPENIIDTALAEGLQVISITDHDSISNVKRAIEYAQGKDILVIPGVELSTINGHLLVYCPSYDLINGFFGKLSLVDDPTSKVGRKICCTGIVEILTIAVNYQGIGIASHIDIDAGFELTMPKYDPSKQLILLCENLLGLEILQASNEIWYSSNDPNVNRRQFFEKRKEKLSEDNGYEIAKVLFSDAHTLSSLGKNASGNKKITRFKMDSLSFNSFRIALLDSGARTRIEDLVPDKVPFFAGINFEGGFLDGQLIKFSKNLTCIIGGRGTGKSSILESLRSCSGNDARGNLVDCEVWPDKITLLYEDTTGRQQILERVKAGNVFNITDIENGITSVLIESYGQGETADTIQHCDKNPGVLIKFLDEFIDMQTLISQDTDLCTKILENQTQIERLSLDVKMIPDIKKAKLNAEQQLNILKSQKAKEIVELEEGLIREKSFREELINNLKQLTDSINNSLSNKTVLNHVLSLDDSKLVVGKTEFLEVKKIIEGYSQEITKTSTVLNSVTKTIRVELIKHLGAWQKKEADVYKRVEEIRKTLELQGIKLDMIFIKKVTKDVNDYNMRLAQLLEKEEELKKKHKERKDLIKERKVLKVKIYQLRQAFALTMNNNLKNTVIDYMVHIKFREGLYSPQLSQVIQKAMNWRQITKAELVSSQMSLYDLLNSIQMKDTRLLENIIDSYGSKVFTASEAQNILDTLDIGENLFKLERCEFEDRAEIKVTKIIDSPDGTKKSLTKDFSKLSLGQQQSILLTILLYSKSNTPLIIDQPEDNLDSEFIYKTLVRNLRRVKEHRQVIIVTHNANIAALGDAELIIPLRSTNTKTSIVDRGSIDSPETRKITCTILEGSEQAFIKRKQIYGI